MRFLSGRNEARKGGCVRAKSQDATDGRVISKKKSSETMIRCQENGRHIIRKCEILKQRILQKKPETNDYDSRRAFVVQSDTKRPKVENMERRPVIIKHRTQRRRTCRIAGRPARDAWKHELWKASGRQIIRKCEILKQKTMEARKRI